MPRFRAITSLVVVASAALVLGGPVTPVEATGGSAGGKVVLDRGVEVFGYGAVTISTGTTYIGWISAPVADVSNRQLHLCVLPPAATSCSGGVQSASAVAPDSAHDLRMAVGSGNHVLLYWQHTTPQSVNSDTGDAISYTVVEPTINTLVDGSDILTAPSFGDLGDLTIDPTGAPALLLLGGLPVSGARVMDLQWGANRISVPSPYPVGSVHIAFSGSHPVLAIDRYGAISSPIKSSTYVGSAWSAWQNVPGAWSVGGAYDLTTSGSTVRLVAPVASASYRPAQHVWNGSSFGAGVPTGDASSCAPTTMDTTSDASGRIATVGSSCAGNAVTNLPSRTLPGGTFRFPIGGTPVNAPEPGTGPQIATRPRGRGWVVWTYQVSSGDALAIAPVILPPAYRRVTGSFTPGSIALTGPRSCLPPTTAAATFTARPHRGWKVVGRKVELDGHAIGATFSGAALAAGTGHKLVGTATFRSTSGVVRTGSASELFSACPNP